MRIAVDAIPDEGQDVTADLQSGWAEKAASEALEGLVSQLDAKLHLRLRDRYVHVTGTATATVERACDRCSEPVRLAVTSQLAFAYGPPGSDPLLDDEIELLEADLDAGFYEDGELDLASVLSEALALELPARVVCSELALCEDRMARLLGAPAPSGSTAFAGLADLVKR